MRYGKLIVSGGENIEGVLEEAKFFEVQSLIEIITKGKAKRALNPFEILQEDLMEEEANIAAVLDEEAVKEEEKKKKK